MDLDFEVIIASLHNPPLRLILIQLLDEVGQQLGASLSYSRVSFFSAVGKYGVLRV